MKGRSGPSAVPKRVLDAVVNISLGEFGGDTDAVHNGALIGTAVAYDADAADAEQRSAAVLGVINALLEVVKGFAAQQRAHLRCDGGLKALAQGGGDEFGDAFTGLKSDVADESVADDDVGPAVVEVAAFDIPDEVKAKLAKQREGVTSEGVALGLFLADGEKAEPRVVDVKNVLGVHVAHNGELDQVVRIAVDVGADVEQDAGHAGGGGKDGGQCGTVDSVERAQDHFRRRHGGTGITGGDEAAGAALTDHLQTDSHGAVALGTDGKRGLVLHADPFAGLNEEDGRALTLAAVLQAESFEGIGKGTAVAILLFEGGAQFWAQDILWAYQMNADVQMAGSQHCPANLRVWGLVGPHGIENDVYRHALCASEMKALTAECKGDVSQCR